MGGVSGGSFVLSWRGVVIRSDCVLAPRDLVSLLWAYE